jgi:hypothetical protein
MVYLQKEANILKFQDVPVGYWIGALLTFGAGLLFLVLIVNDIRSDDGISVLSVIMTMYFLGAAVYFGRAQMSETTVDRNLKIVAINRKGLFGRNFKSFKYDDVQGGAILRSVVGRKGRIVFWIQLLMKEGKTIDIMTREDPNEGPIFEAVASINEYLGMATASSDYVPTRLLDDPNEL